MNWWDIPPIVWLLAPLILGLILCALTAIVERIWPE